MLILARKAGESIRIGDEVKLTVLRVRKNEVRLGLEAPREVLIRSPERDTTPASDESKKGSDDS